MLTLSVSSSSLSFLSFSLSFCSHRSQKLSCACVLKSLFYRKWHIFRLLLFYFFPFSNTTIFPLWNTRNSRVFVESTYRYLRNFDGHFSFHSNSFHLFVCKAGACSMWRPRRRYTSSFPISTDRLFEISKISLRTLRCAFSRLSADETRLRLDVIWSVWNPVDGGKKHGSTVVHKIRSTCRFIFMYAQITCFPLLA